jgi:hypothetical protein
MIAHNKYKFDNVKIRRHYVKNYLNHHLLVQVKFINKNTIVPNYALLHNLLKNLKLLNNFTSIKFVANKKIFFLFNYLNCS